MKLEPFTFPNLTSWGSTAKCDHSFYVFKKVLTSTEREYVIVLVED